MPGTVEQAEPSAVTPRSVFIVRFITTIALWSVALVIAFSGYELAFYALICAFGLIALWEFYGMLDHRGLPNFKVTGMICGTVMLVGSFYYFAKIGPAQSYDFETAVLLFFLLTVFARQMFARLRHDEPLQTMAYTLFGLLYVLWLFNFITKIVYVMPRSSSGAVTGQFYVLYLIGSRNSATWALISPAASLGAILWFPTSAQKRPGKDFSARSFLLCFAAWLCSN